MYWIVLGLSGVKTAVYRMSSILAGHTWCDQTITSEMRNVSSCEACTQCFDSAGEVAILFREMQRYDA